MMINPLKNPRYTDRQNGPINVRQDKAILTQIFDDNVGCLQCGGSYAQRYDVPAIYFREQPYALRFKQLAEAELALAWKDPANHITMRKPRELFALVDNTLVLRGSYEVIEHTLALLLKTKEEMRDIFNNVQDMKNIDAVSKGVDTGRIPIVGPRIPKSLKDSLEDATKFAGRVINGSRKTRFVMKSSYGASLAALDLDALLAEAFKAKIESSFGENASRLLTKAAKGRLFVPVGNEVRISNAVPHHCIHILKQLIQSQAPEIDRMLLNAQFRAQKAFEEERILPDGQDRTR